MKRAACITEKDGQIHEKRFFPIIGMDFDNTIISYDNLIHELALEKGLIDPEHRKTKRHIRDSIRQLPDGETRWQELQAKIYGPGIAGARLMDGIACFFKLCRQYAVKTYIVSHKTKFAKLDETGTNLRTAAMDWMRTNSFFDKSALGLSENDVFLEQSRREKISRISQLGCTHFIDDLEETFEDELFPTDVKKIIFAPSNYQSSVQGVIVFRTWKEIGNRFFRHQCLT